MMIIRIAILFFLAPCLCTPAAAETLTIPGSGNPEYILGELAKVFNTQQKSHTIVIPPTIGHAGALRAISEGNTSMARVGRPLKEEERGIGLTYHSLGRDSIVFVGGEGVSVRDISPAQVLGIISGQLVNWQELGGKSATIRTIGREKTDASSLGIARGMKDFGAIKYSDATKVVHLDSQSLELLDRFHASFGFLNRSALSAAKTRLVYLSLDGIEANAENVESGRYPLWTEMGLIYREEALTEAGRAFLKFVKSPAGLQLLRSNGLASATAK